MKPRLSRPLDAIPLGCDHRKLSLEPGRIHLWVTEHAQIADPALLDAYRAMLTPDEREKECRYRFGKDRRRHVVTRALIRTALSRHTGVEPRTWRFTTNEYGRPEISDGCAASSRPSFNVTHTDQVTVLAVMSGGALGVDAEPAHGELCHDALARRYFAPPEIRALSELPPERRGQRFIDYWCLKEAYVKALGRGLTVDLDRFWFAFRANGSVALHVGQEHDDDRRRWRFWLLRLPRDHVAAVCAEAQDGADPNHAAPLTVRACTPLLEESEMPLDLRCAST